MIYEPERFINATKDAIAVLGSKEQEDTEITPKMRELFKKVAEAAKDQRSALGLRYCLTRREFSLLLKYYLEEADDTEFTRLTPVILEDADEGSMQLLYPEILSNYGEGKVLSLAEHLKGSKAFAGFLKNKYNLPAAEFLSALTAGEFPAFMNREAGAISGGGAGYADALKKLGIEDNTRLYKECGKLYIFVCDAAAYLTMGCDALSKMSEGFEAPLRAELLRNMLTVMDSYQLRNFVPMIDFFAEAVGTPGSDSYVRTLTDLGKAATDKYDLLINQRSIYKAFGQSERATFWYGYSGACKIADLANVGALVFVFENFVCIEPYIEDAAYFYVMEYYNETVKPGSVGRETPEEYFNFLFKKTEWAAEGVKPKRWRRAHTGNWQLDYRNYIMERLHS